MEYALNPDWCACAPRDNLNNVRGGDVEILSDTGDNDVAPAAAEKVDE